MNRWIDEKKLLPSPFNRISSNHFFIKKVIFFKWPSISGVQFTGKRFYLFSPMFGNPPLYYLLIFYNQLLHKITKYKNYHNIFDNQHNKIHEHEILYAITKCFACVNLLPQHLKGGLLYLRMRESTLYNVERPLMSAQGERHKMLSVRIHINIYEYLNLS